MASKRPGVILLAVRTIYTLATITARSFLAWAAVSLMIAITLPLGPLLALFAVMALLALVALVSFLAIRLIMSLVTLTAR